MSPRFFGLSKSRLLSYRQCAKKLWLSIQKPELSSESPAVEARFATGHRVGEIARAEYLFFSERPLFSVTMIAGARREILSVDELYAGVSCGRISKSDLAYCDCQVLLDRTYFLPLGDKSWPDDTLIEFEYMDEGNDPRGIAAPPLAPTRQAPR